MKSSLFSLKLLVVAFALVATAAQQDAGAQATAKPQTKVSLRLDWKPGGQHVPFFLGKEKGYYAAEGVDLTIISGSGSSDSVSNSAPARSTWPSSMLSSWCSRRAARSGQGDCRLLPAHPHRSDQPEGEADHRLKQTDGRRQDRTKRASATSQGLTALMAVANIDRRSEHRRHRLRGAALLVGQVDALMGFTMNEVTKPRGPAWGAGAHGRGQRCHRLRLDVASSEKF